MRNVPRWQSGFASRMAIGLLLLPFAIGEFTHPARAENYPDRSVKMIVPFPAGGTADIVTRLIADRLAQKWGQPVIVENQAGAGGNIGAEFVYRAVPDGYTLLSTPPAPLAINRSLYRELAFDPEKFEPIIVVGQVPDALVVNPKRIAASTLAEFIAYLRAHSDQVTVATQGIGTTSHLASEQFQAMANVRLRNIPYRGSAPALQGLLAGDVDMMIGNFGVVLPSVNAGDLKLLAVASPQRMAALPDVPAIAEALPGFEAVAWYGIVAPPKTPGDITAKVNADVNEILRQPDMQERLKTISATVIGGSIAETSHYLREEADRWSKVIRDADIRIP